MTKGRHAMGDNDTTDKVDKQRRSKDSTGKVKSPLSDVFAVLTWVRRHPIVLTILAGAGGLTQEHLDLIKDVTGLQVFIFVVVVAVLLWMDGVTSVLRKMEGRLDVGSVKFANLEANDARQSSDIKNVRIELRMLTYRKLIDMANELASLEEAARHEDLERTKKIKAGTGKKPKSKDRLRPHPGG